MRQILLATNNKHKVTEIKDIIGKSDYELITLSDLNLEIEVIEDKDTLEGNAIKKAEEVFLRSKIPVLADDTGLFVDAINGEPGVFSSRYAGVNATYDDNCKKLLDAMKDVPEENRTAYFKTVVCYYKSENSPMIFEGICRGRISMIYRGYKGFGYDPLFIPEGFDKTFAEMSEKEKNFISHRSKAFMNLRDFLFTNLD
ncbi:MAG TPA: RdgB/HAM1 family non-canonical purine NTP pyrophosphatase [Ignavibacteria bacterium]